MECYMSGGEGVGVGGVEGNSPDVRVLKESRKKQEGWKWDSLRFCVTRGSIWLDGKGG